VTSAEISAWIGAHPHLAQAVDHTVRLALARMPHDIRGFHHGPTAAMWELAIICADHASLQWP